MIFIILLIVMEMVDEYFERNWWWTLTPKRYIRNLKDPLGKFNNDIFFKRYRFPKVPNSNEPIIRFIKYLLYQ